MTNHYLRYAEVGGYRILQVYREGLWIRGSAEYTLSAVEDYLEDSTKAIWAVSSFHYFHAQLEEDGPMVGFTSRHEIQGETPSMDDIKKWMVSAIQQVQEATNNLTWEYLSLEEDAEEF